MPNISEIKSSCVGCSACKASCPKNCIAMEMDDEGFLFPNIDFLVCSSCGKCDAICPVINYQKIESKKRAFYGWHKNAETRFCSSSGGVFAALAKNVISDGGAVFGAVFDAERKFIVHKSTDNIDLKKLQKSKYVESGLLDTFKEVKEILKNDRQVLFCSTPCQIAGLVSYIGKNNKLITCDFVCHGVPSGGLFKEHLEYKEHLYKYPITDVDFRPKKMGWTGKSINIEITTTTMTTTTPYFYDSFYKGFMADYITLRKSCYACKFADNHVSDITLADFWGYRKFDPSLNDEKGISLIIANTVKGEMAIENTSNEFDLRDLDMEYAEYIYQRKDYKPFVEKRDNFFELASQVGFEKAAKKSYFKNNAYKYAKYRLKEQIKKLIKYQKSTTH